MKIASLLIILLVLSLCGLIYFTPGTKLDLKDSRILTSLVTNEVSSTLRVTASGTPSTTTKASNVSYSDIEPQIPLPNPPKVIKAVYATAWSAGSSKKSDYFINLIKSTELNAIVIDIKDFSGHVLYDIQNEDVIRYGAKEVRIPRVNTLIKRLHDEGIYVIARQTMFQDPVLTKARPDLAVQKDEVVSPAVIETNGTSTHSTGSTGSLQASSGQAIVLRATTTKRVTWLDSKGLGWIDPGAKYAWDYNIAIAKDAASRGFDEINFDYVRFPSDGDISIMRFNHYDEKNTLKLTQIQHFFEYLRKEMADITISADLFGLVTVNNDDLGIGQNLKVAAQYFDAIAPMVYPSHFAKGFIGFSNPAAHPAEVVSYSMQQAIKKIILEAANCDEKSTTTVAKDAGTTTSATPPCVAQTKYMEAKLRPWLQDFDLGATYDAPMVRAQINAVDKILKDSPPYQGWMIWAPSNVYTMGALNPE